MLHVVCEFNETAEPTRVRRPYSFHAPEVECITYEGMRIVGLPEG